MSPWLPDLNNDKYKNPVLNADYSDPDAVRVGDDYWMTSSSFCHVPGLPILHSRDLINWTLVNHALPALVPHDYFSTVRHGQGVWAPSIRFHGGKFWIYYPDPDFGIYVITATDPRGAWSDPVCVKPGKGLIDPCPLWDDDGSVWLIHGWAKSRSGICNILTLHRISNDGKRIDGQGDIVIDGNAMEGWDTIEGPKLYKRNGWYYIFAPAGGVATGYQAVFRSRKINGPYESRIVLEQGSTPVNGPHQGAWVDTPAGEHWFLHFQELPAMGRVVHLQPMRWENDWPVIGTAVAGKNGAIGQPVLIHSKPLSPRQPIAAPATSDDFSVSSIGRQWQWQANPRSEWARTHVASNTLQLTCMPMVTPGSHWMTPSLFMQKFPCTEFAVDVTMEFPTAESKPGDHAGLIVFGYDYAWFGVENDRNSMRVVMKSCEKAQDGNKEQTLASVEMPESPVLHLRVDVTKVCECRFSYSIDGRNYTPVGNVFFATSSKWVGGKVGMFAASIADTGVTRRVGFREFSVSEHLSDEQSKSLFHPERSSAGNM
jgi:beta-xylosidase